MTYAVQPLPRPEVPVAGGDSAFPVHRIYCVGRNYAAHAREMGADPDREPPFFFAKPADAVICGMDDLPYPPDTADLHHEIELVVALGRGGANVSRDEALGLVFGYAVGVDLTRRDRQAEAKKAGRPWDVAKGFDRSAPISPIRPMQGQGLESGHIWLGINSETRQEGDLADMIWPVADVIAHLSRSFELQPGDLIFTGTPEGVGPIKPGEHVTGGVEGVGEIGFTVTN
ncbi:MAG: fumarylacetoacetate hydrolase family protein [Caulobacteraceae bacterium]